MTKVFMLCTFLGYVNRGHESFTRECFNALSKESSLNITLFKGGEHSHGKEVTPWNLLLNGSWMADKLSQALGKLRQTKKEHVQQVSFFLSLLPYIAGNKPDVIYFSERNLGNLLGKWRHLTKQNYKLLFSNGAPFLPPFPLFDHIHQVTPVYLKAALDRGVPAEKQTLLPHGFNIASELEMLKPLEKEALRNQLGLPTKCPLIISVGIVKESHKRMDYVVREVAGLPEPRPYLLLLGDQVEETSKILELGNKLLGAEHFSIRTVPYNEIVNYYKVADAFVLASLNEGFGRVYVEAMTQGLPCLAHDYEVSRFVLKEQGYYANFNLSGSLTNLISRVLAEGQDYSRCHSRHRSVYERFSWEKLSSSYVESFHRVANKNS